MAGDQNAAGAMPLRRLNNREYNNTVRDLLGDTTNPASAFPLDYELAAFQYHRAGDISPEDLDNQKDAAKKLAAAAVATPDKLNAVAPCAKGAAEDACAQDFIKNFGLRAYRRPLEADETARLTTLYQAGRTKLMMSYQDAVGLVVEAMLQSPNFLYLWKDGIAKPVVEGNVIKLSPYEVASRLSYFIWSSMPDQALFEAAASNKLNTEDDLRTQATRMLGDAKATDTVANFIDEWMNTDTILSPATVKDDRIYPSFNDALREAMDAESHTFINDVMASDAKLSSLLLSTNSKMNATLAAVYGKTDVKGTTPTATTLDPAERGGFMTRATFLTVTSSTSGSHPVKRGRRIFERLLCNVMPPPPVDANNKPPTLDANLKGTTRQKFEQHETNPCSFACHRIVDQFGYAFEHYDGIGAYRTMDNGSQVNSAGSTELNGQTFNFKDAIDLSKQLASNAAVESCFTAQWLRFAFKRADGDGDAASLTNVTNAFDKTNSIKDVLVGLAGSHTFRYRSPEAGEMMQ